MLCELKQVYPVNRVLLHFTQQLKLLIKKKSKPIVSVGFSEYSKEYSKQQSN